MNASPPAHLIVVCGHGIWLGGPKKGWDESEWLIESYKAGETPTFIAHIRAGVELASAQPDAVLVFSGGPTRPETSLSEAASYARLAAANDYFGLPPPPRILLEERALDSYYNILFSVVLFWRAHGAWPTRLTIVSHAFKRARLVDAHCAAIAFPLDRVRFVGIDPPGVAAALGSSSGKGAGGDGGGGHDDKAEAMRGVREAADLWTEDVHGVGAVLAAKRRKRNPWGVDQRLFLTDEERARSGVRTRFLDDGTEALAGDGPVQVPWATSASAS